MTDDLLSLRTMVVSHEDGLRDLFRRAASASVLPTEIVDGGDGADLSGRGADLVYLDGVSRFFLPISKTCCAAFMVCARSIRGGVKA